VCTIQSRLGQPSFGSGKIGPGCPTDQTVRNHIFIRQWTC
jgi:hypothetical protein